MQRLALSLGRKYRKAKSFLFAEVKFYLPEIRQNAGYRSRFTMISDETTEAINQFLYRAATSRERSGGCSGPVHQLFPPRRSKRGTGCDEAGEK